PRIFNRLAVAGAGLVQGRARAGPVEKRRADESLERLNPAREGGWTQRQREGGVLEGRSFGGGQKGFDSRKRRRPSQHAHPGNSVEGNVAAKSRASKGRRRAFIQG